MIWLLLIYLGDTVTAVSKHETLIQCETAKVAMQQQHIEAICIARKNK